MKRLANIKEVIEVPTSKLGAILVVALSLWTGCIVDYVFNIQNYRNC